MSAVDPLEFTLAALSRRGALVERSDDGYAVLPPALGAELGTGLEVRLSTSARDGVVACGIGSALLDRLVARARDRCQVAYARLDAPAPRASQAEAAAARIAVRNGVCQVGTITSGEVGVLAAVVTWVAEADDRDEGTVNVLLELAHGGEPDAHYAELVGLDAPRAVLQSAPPVVLSDRAAALELLGARAALGARASTLEIVARVERRQQRERERIIEYFTALADESKKSRRAADRTALASRLGQYAAERDAKLADLATRYAVRLRFTPAALVHIATPAARIELRLRRRKAERTLTAVLPSGARAVNRFACEGCHGLAEQPLLCDDALHVLCERCCPSADGRPRCPACSTRR